MRLNSGFWTGEPPSKQGLYFASIICCFSISRSLRYLMQCLKYSYSYKLSRKNLTKLKTSFAIQSSDPWIETCGPHSVGWGTSETPSSSLYSACGAVTRSGHGLPGNIRSSDGDFWFLFLLFKMCCIIFCWFFDQHPAGRKLFNKLAK